MDAFQHLREQIATILTDAGIEVSLDPRASPPTVLVDAPSLVEAQNNGATWSVTVPIRIIAPPPGNVEALNFLLEQLEPTLAALGPDVSARSSTYLLNDKECPAYSIDYRTDLTTPCP